MVHFSAATSVAFVQLVFLAQITTSLPVRSTVVLESRALSTDDEENHNQRLSERTLFNPIPTGVGYCTGLFVVGAVCQFAYSRKKPPASAQPNEPPNGSQHDVELGNLPRPSSTNTQHSVQVPPGGHDSRSSTSTDSSATSHEISPGEGGRAGASTGSRLRTPPPPPSQARPHWRPAPPPPVGARPNVPPRPELPARTYSRNAGQISRRSSTASLVLHGSGPFIRRSRELRAREYSDKLDRLD